jgi:TPR repeat protein
VQLDGQCTKKLLNLGTVCRFLRDYDQAVHWYTRAAEQGDSDAQYNLALSYEEGTGVAQDYAQALTWYMRSAEQGDPDAQFAVGTYHEQGLSVPEDAELARSWYQKAAMQGHLGAARALKNL